MSRYEPVGMWVDDELHIDLAPEVSVNFWLDGTNRVGELGSEISDILNIRSDI